MTDRATATRDADVSNCFPPIVVDDIVCTSRDTYRPAQDAWVRDAYARALPVDGNALVRSIVCEADARTAESILSAHPDADEKAGPVRTGQFVIFAIADERAEPALHLAVVRADGTLGRLRRTNPYAGLNPHQRLMRVLRSSVRDQTRRERRELEARDPVCAECGVAVTPDTGQLDHAPIPFTMLASAWLETQRDVPLRKARLTADTASRTRTASQLANRQQLAAWRAFHQAHARYRLTCGPCNDAAGDHGTRAALTRAKEI